MEHPDLNEALIVETETETEVELESEVEDYQDYLSEPQPPVCSITSPTLLQLQSSELEAVSGTACARCPKAVWMRSDSVQAYCTVMHTIVDQFVISCDGVFLPETKA